MVLLHGLGCSCESWGPTLREAVRLGLGQPVYAADFPGYGCSADPPDVMGMADLADWTARLMDALHIPKAHLAGNSMGGQVALAFARRHAGRVGGLALVGPTFGDHIVSFARYFVGLTLDGVMEPLAYNLLLCKMYAQMGLVRYLATVPKMMEDNPLADPDAMQAPCLVIRGEHDQIIPDWAARKLTARLPHSAFLRLKGTAHALEFNKPREFLEAALPWWREAEEAHPQPPPHGEGALQIR